MQDTPCSGYTVKASEFTKFLPKFIRKKYTQAIADQDDEQVDELLNKHLPSEFPGYESAFVLKGDDNAEDLEKGEVYVIFQAEDLFIQTPSPGAIAMKNVGIVPKFNRWTSWG